MYAVETLKKNITDLLSTLAFVFDEDEDAVIDFICDMDFPEIYNAIRKRMLPIYRHATGSFDQEQPMYISEKLLPQEGTLICRDINRWSCIRLAVPHYGFRWKGNFRFSLYH